MTSQIGDILHYEGSSYRIASEPPLSCAEPGRYEIRFLPAMTACWRGYIAEWAIAEDKLYLNGVSGSANVIDLVRYREEKLKLRKRLKQGEITPAMNGKMLRDLKNELTVEKKIDLQFLFNATEPVFAEWVSGVIRVPMGNLLESTTDELGIGDWINGVIRIQGGFSLPQEHEGYRSANEEDLLLSFTSGILTEKKVVKTNRSEFR